MSSNFEPPEGYEAAEPPKTAAEAPEGYDEAPSDEKPATAAASDSGPPEGYEEADETKPLYAGKPAGYEPKTSMASPEGGPGGVTGFETVQPDENAARAVAPPARTTPPIQGTLAAKAAARLAALKATANPSDADIAQQAAEETAAGTASDIAAPAKKILGTLKPGYDWAAEKLRPAKEAIEKNPTGGMLAEAGYQTARGWPFHASDETAETVGGGLEEAFGGAAGGMLTPDNITLLVGLPVVPAKISAAILSHFSSEGSIQAVTQAKEIFQHWGEMSQDERKKALGGLITGTAFAVLPAAHALGEAGKVTTPHQGPYEWEKGYQPPESWETLKPGEEGPGKEPTIDQEATAPPPPGYEEPAPKAPETPTEPTKAPTQEAAAPPPPGYEEPGKETAPEGEGPPPPEQPTAEGAMPLEGPNTVFPGPERSGTERRGEGRPEPGRRVADMAPEEMKKALLTDDQTGLPNTRAWDEKEAAGELGPVKVMMDLDNFKAINTKYGHEGGDVVIEAMGQAARDVGLGDILHRISRSGKGDEFAGHFADEEMATRAIQALHDRILNAEIDIPKEDGSVVTLKGVDFTHGTGPSLESADVAAGTAKVARTAEGLRAAGRDELSPRIAELDRESRTEGDQAPRPAEGAGAPEAARAEGEAVGAAPGEPVARAEEPEAERSDTRGGANEGPVTEEGRLPAEPPAFEAGEPGAAPGAPAKPTGAGQADRAMRQRAADLLRDVRFRLATKREQVLRDAGFTAAQARRMVELEQQKRLEPKLGDEAESARPGRPAQSQVELQSQLEAAGQSKRVADAGARLVDHVYSTLGKWTGLSKEKVWEQRGLAVEHAAEKPEGAMYQHGIAAPTFYSAVEKAVGDQNFRTMPADQFASWLKKQPNIKQEELDWIGLDDFLKDKKTVSKEELMKFLDENRVQVEPIQYDTEPRMGKASVDAARKAYSEASREYSDLNSRFRYLAEKNGMSQLQIVNSIAADPGKRSAWGATYATEALGNAAKAMWDANDRVNRAEDAMRAAWKESPGPKYNQPSLSLSGERKNYREVLLRLPGESDAIPPDVTRLLNERMQAEVARNEALSKGDAEESRRLKAEWERLDRELGEAQKKRPPRVEKFTGGHFSDRASNVGPHLRMTDRIDTDGKKVLNVEEFQDDWAKEGKKGSFATPEGKARVEEIGKELEAIFRSKEYGDKDYPRSDELDRKVHELQTERDRLRHHTVPDRPFKKSWPLLAFKWALRHAAENGYDRLTWTTGEQQNERYPGLAEHVERISFERLPDEKTALWIENKDGGMVDLAGRGHGEWDENRKAAVFKNGDIPALIGADPAERIAKHPEKEGALTGLNLQMGGEGMKAFYDRLLPNEVNKYVKRWGARVGEARIETAPSHQDISADLGEDGRWQVNDLAERGTNAPPLAEFDTEEEANAYVASIEGGRKSGEKVHSLDITPAMRESVTKGQPLFQKGEKKAPPLTEAEMKWMEETGAKPIDTPDGERYFEVPSASRFPNDKGGYFSFGPEGTTVGRAWRSEILDSPHLRAVLDRKRRMEARTAGPKKMIPYHPDSPGAYWEDTPGNRLASQYDGPSLDEHGKPIESPGAEGEAVQHGGPETPEPRRTGPGGQGELFQRGAEPQGSFDPATRYVQLFKAADESTFAHEAAHAFRRDLYWAAENSKLLYKPRLKSDLAALEEWVGAEPGGKWNEESEEKFARGFEAYLRSGQTPRLESKAATRRLAQVFERFSAWLKDIYKTVKGSPIDVEIPDEIKGVLDRLMGKPDEETQAEPSHSGWFAARLPSEVKLGKERIPDAILDSIEAQKDHGAAQRALENVKSTVRQLRDQAREAPDDKDIEKQLAMAEALRTVQQARVEDLHPTGGRGRGLELIDGIRNWYGEKDHEAAAKEALRKNATDEGSKLGTSLADKVDIRRNPVSADEIEEAHGAEFETPEPPVGGEEAPGEAPPDTREAPAGAPEAGPDDAGVGEAPRPAETGELKPEDDEEPRFAASHPVAGILNDIFGSKTPGKKTVTKENDPLAAASPEVEERLKTAEKGLVSPGVLERIRDAGKNVAASFKRHFKDIDPAESKTMALTQDILRQYEAAPHYAKESAAVALSHIVEGLDESGLKVFRRILALKDLERSVEEGLYDEKSLPFGYESLEEAQADRKKYEGIANLKENTALKRALDRRDEFATELTHQLVDRDLLDADVLKDSRYYHRQVLAYFNIREGQAVGTGSRDVRLHRKGFQKERVGGTDFNLKYQEAEFEWVSQALAQIQTDETLERLQGTNDIAAGLKSRANHQNEVLAYGGEVKWQRAQQIRSELREMYESGADVEPSVKNRLQDELYAIDPLYPFRSRKATAIEKLQELADKGLLDDVPAQFERAVYDLKGVGSVEDARFGDFEDSDPEDAGQGSKGRFFALLNYLLNAEDPKRPGSGPAAGFFKAMAEQKKLIKDTAGKDFVTFRDLIPEKHPLAPNSRAVVWQPEKGSRFFLARTLPERAVARMTEALEQGVPGVTPEDMKAFLEKAKTGLVRGGPKEEWVIPEGLARTLDNWQQGRHETGLEQAQGKLLTLWKQWILFNPIHALKYNLNNTSGELDATLASYPGAAKYFDKAARDLWSFGVKQKFTDKAVTDELLDATKRGVLGSGHSYQEIPDINAAKAFRDLASEDPNIVKTALSRYWTGTKDFSKWRENVIRLSLFRYLRDRMAAGETDLYGASKRNEVDAIQDPVDRAAKVSRETINDYGNISVAGQYIRRHLIPFWAWTEMNLPRYYRLLKNSPAEGGSEGGAALRVAGVGAAKAARFALKASVLYGAVQAWNNIVFPEEEKALARDRKQLHLILGRSSDGSIRSIRFQGALSDALSWVGLENVVANVKEAAAGRRTWKDQLADAVKAPIDKIAQGWEPMSKTLFELRSGTKSYPSIFNEGTDFGFAQRPIRDRAEYAADSAGFPLGALYRKVTGKPKRPGLDLGVPGAGELLDSLVAYKTDPGEAAYWQSKDLVRRWLESQGKVGGGGAPGGAAKEMGDALYYYKKASEWGDDAAARRWLVKYFEAGGTLKSMNAGIRREHPLGGLPLGQRAAFSGSLRPADREALIQAIDWYSRGREKMGENFSQAPLASITRKAKPIPSVYEDEEPTR